MQSASWRLPAPAAPGADEIRCLVEDLDSEQFDIRKKTHAELERIGLPAAPLLRKALESDPSPEKKKRIDALLAKMSEIAPQGETLRSLRAIEVLEMIGTPEAKTVLEGLAKGTPGATVTQAAKESLQRLNR